MNSQELQKAKVNSMKLKTMKESSMKTSGMMRGPWRPMMLFTLRKMQRFLK
ncbi:hypothetical protein DPMN_090298 [Dreissena polymorpha]|uniref:Uncharacterized protein n=1 Tax=Dreissena polymorpha TaxID=45954 RepID=A0A9D4KZG3_DREPO|nr:hypothetical protein DPMN_090298 [Dreissena polymorpha]